AHRCGITRRRRPGISARQLQVRLDLGSRGAGRGTPVRVVGLDVAPERSGVRVRRDGLQRGMGALVVRGLALLLAAAALPACLAAAGAPGIRTVAVTIHYSHFSPASLTVAVGETVRFRITNRDPRDRE